MAWGSLGLAPNENKDELVALDEVLPAKLKLGTEGAATAAPKSPPVVGLLNVDWPG